MKKRSRVPLIILLVFILLGFPFSSSLISTSLYVFSEVRAQGESPTAAPTTTSRPSSTGDVSIYLPIVGQPSRLPDALVPSFPAAGPGEAVILAAGDIADCASDGDEQTAVLVMALDGSVLALGDEALPDGTPQEFANCYDPSWGQFKARTFPTPGNHDYQTQGAAGYFSYFGPAAGDPSRGYYSFNMNSWHVISINSDCEEIGGCDNGSLEELWLLADLAAHPAQCTLAYWHHPLFGSGGEGGSSRMKDIWQDLYDHGVDVVINGHNHDYERFAPQDSNGMADPSRGITEFIAGTGGKDHADFRTLLPNSVVRDKTSFGVLRMVLKPGEYSWQFIPVTGASFTDSGEAACH